MQMLSNKMEITKSRGTVVSGGWATELITRSSHRQADNDVGTILIVFGSAMFCYFIIGWLYSRYAEAT